MKIDCRRLISSSIRRSATSDFAALALALNGSSRVRLRRRRWSVVSPCWLRVKIEGSRQDACSLVAGRPDTWWGESDFFFNSFSFAYGPKIYCTVAQLFFWAFGFMLYRALSLLVFLPIIKLQVDKKKTSKFFKFIVLYNFVDLATLFTWSNSI